MNNFKNGLKGYYCLEIDIKSMIYIVVTFLLTMRCSKHNITSFDSILKVVTDRETFFLNITVFHTFWRNMCIPRYFEAF